MNARTTRTAANAAQIISDLYEGVLDEVAWRRALDAVARSVQGVGPGLLTIDPASGQCQRLDVPGYPAETLAAFRDEWSRKDVRFAAGISMPLLQLHTEEMILRKGEWERTEVFNEFLCPKDAGWFLAAWLHKSSTRVTALSIHAPRDRGPFDARDVATAQPFIAHLRRALDLKERLEAEQVRGTSLHRFLDNAPFGYAILDECGVICEISDSAISSLQTVDGLRRLHDGRFEVADRLWRRLPTSGAVAERVGPADGHLHVPRANLLPLGLVVSRVPNAVRTWLGSPPAWLLFVFDPERRVQASIEVLVQDLGITRKEAELASLLAAGLDVHGAAHRLAISEHTARQHLKSIYSKADIHSQAELVRRGGRGWRIRHKTEGAEVARRQRRGVGKTAATQSQAWLLPRPTSWPRVACAGI